MVVAAEVVVAGNFAEISTGFMAVLLGWGVANVGIGLFRCREKELVRRYFWQMNFAWGAVDALLAGVTLAMIAGDYSRFMVDRALQTRQMNIVGWNGLLDVLYVLVGLMLIKYRAANRSERRLGYGRSIVVQGGFLLVFDALLFLAMRAVISG